METKPLLHLSLLCGNLERHRRMYSLSTHGVRQSIFQTLIPNSTLDVDKFGGLASCITTFGFILVPIERLRVVNKNSSCIGMWSSSSSRWSYMIFIHNFMKVSMEPSSFVMIPLFWDTKFSCLLKSYKCCLSQHVKNAINNPTCITHHSQLSQIVQILLVFQQKGSDNPWF
jgi:hypothetical protein